jgi:7-cyano-7-deazaguanine synthase
MKTLVVLSGGLDSSVMLAHVMQSNEVIGCLTFWYGSKHNEREYRAACLITEHYKVNLKRIGLDFIPNNFKSDLLLSGGDIPKGHYEHESMKRTVVPFRNGIMLSIAAGYAESIEAEQIAIGNHFGDHAIYPDCRKSFIEPMQQAIKAGTEKNIILASPFCDLKKEDIVRIGQQLNVPMELTYSCYEGKEIHCGECGTCTERKEAFVLAGIKDPTEYLK